MKRFQINKDKTVKVPDNFVDVSLALTNKVDLGKIEGKQYYGFICLQCKRLRCGVPSARTGGLRCNFCGFEPRTAW